MAINYENVNGRITFYGPTDVTHRFGAAVADDDGVIEVEMELTADQFPVTYDVGNNMFAAVPAHAGCLSVDVHIIEAFDALVTLNVGLIGTDGTAIDPDGLVAAADAATVGFVAGAGVLVGADIGALDAVHIAALSGASAGGKVRIVARYSVPTHNAASFGGPDVIPSTF